MWQAILAALGAAKTGTDIYRNIKGNDQTIVNQAPFTLGSGYDPNQAAQYRQYTPEEIMAYMQMHNRPPPDADPQVLAMMGIA